MSSSRLVSAVALITPTASEIPSDERASSANTRTRSTAFNAASVQSVSSPAASTRALKSAGPRRVLRSRSAINARSHIAGSPSLRWSQVTVRSTWSFTTTRLFSMTSTNGFMSSVYGAL